jgi:hypothetical protein
MLRLWLAKKLVQRGINMQLNTVCVVTLDSGSNDMSVKLSLCRTKHYAMKSCGEWMNRSKFS